MSPESIPTNLPVSSEHPLPAEVLEADRNHDRLDHLNDVFLDLAKGSGPTDPSSLEYIRRGGSLRLCLNEIIELSEPTQADVIIGDFRDSYLRDLMQRRVLKTVLRRSSQYPRDEELYIDSVLGKIGALIDARTPDEALGVRQMPTLVEAASFDQDSDLSLENLAGDHLYLLIDVLLKEHVERRDFIDNYRKHSKLSKALGNRALRVGIAGGIFVASLSPKLGVIPKSSDIVSEDIDTTLTALSATIFGMELPEEIRYKRLDKKHNKRTKELDEELAENQRLSDLALRMTYGSTRYGGPDDIDITTGRSGTADKERNLERFAKLDEEFTHLTNDPGGKPYSGNQALGYAARLIIERDKQLKEIIDPEKLPTEKRALFMELAREMLVEDLERMKKGLSDTEFRKTLIRGISVIPALFFPSYISAVNDASSMSHDTVEALDSGPDLEEDYEQ
jgi:hypothetical protein